ncbi:MAG: radical SAM protein [candidate division KSB1 bacterium]|nr:radical SAM protein [candidate division KSB1 bacterium]
MIIKEIEAKSILRKHKRIDSWFVSCYGMNFYRGCAHNCVYCDGRAEKYQVEGEFGKEVAVKINAIEILRRELDPKRKRVPLKKCFMMIGGGVGDSYQPIEQKYRLTRQALELMLEFKLPAHVLTKSTLIERDMDLLKQINEQTRAIANFSFSSVDDEISAIFEPGVPSPSCRLETIIKFKQAGIPCGLFLMPVIPFVTDTPEQIEKVFRKAKEIGIDYIIFSGMTLKDGRQKQYFLNVLKNHYPELIADYQHIFQPNEWGQAIDGYYRSIHQTLLPIAQTYHIPIRMPLHLFSDILEENDLVEVLLGHIDYLCKIQGRSSPFGYAAYSISQLKQPLSSMRGQLQKIKGVGSTTERIIIEILDTGKTTYLEKIYN